MRLVRRSTEQLELLSAIEDTLERSTARSSMMPSVLKQLQLLLRAEAAAHYSIVPAVDGFELDQYVLEGWRAPKTLTRDNLGRWVRGTRRGLGLYDPIRPSRSQRNVAHRLPSLAETATVASFDQLRLRFKPQGVPAQLALALEVHRTAGMHQMAQLRVLVCDGPLMLGWLGVMRHESFTTREQELLTRLIPALRRRLKLERQLELGAAAPQILDAVLDDFGAAALIVSTTGRVLHANARARQRLEGDRSVLRESIALAARHVADVPGFRVQPIDVDNSKWLLLVESGREPRITQALATFGRRYGLTRRQAEVLGHLVNGEANKSIASHLGCSVGTVQLHVHALLEKCGCESRSALAARFWGSVHINS